MNPFVDRKELLRRLDFEYRRFHDEIAFLTPEQMQIPGVIGRWSVKDLMAHFIVHEQFALQELEHALSGKPFYPSETDPDAINERAVSQWHSRSLDDVLHAWDVSYHQVVAAVSALADGAFSPTSSVVQRLEDTIDGALGNNTYQHYAEHLPSVEAWVQRQSETITNKHKEERL